MKIALAQMEVKAGRPDLNLETMLKMAEDAKKKGARLIAFPEMSVGGYLVGDKWNNDEFCQNLMIYNETLKEASGRLRMAISWGNVYLDTQEEIRKRTGSTGWHPGKDGRDRRYNAVFVAQDGEWAPRKFTEMPYSTLPPGIQPKALLPTYRFFDDYRYFFSLEDIAKDFGKSMKELAQPFMITDEDGKKIPIGFETCEDLWCEDYRKDGRSINPTRNLVENGAKIIINASASPWTYGKNDARDRRVKFLKEDIGDNFVPFLYVNHTGVQNNGKNFVTFDGGTTVYNSDAKPVILSSERYQEELISVDTETIDTLPELTRTSGTETAEKYDAIIRGIQHIKDIQGRIDHPRYIIGLSGGIDSAVVAALLVRAVGAENVIAINMPTRYNSEQTKNAAKGIAEKLRIRYETVPVGELSDLAEKLVACVFGPAKTEDKRKFDYGNLTARQRTAGILATVAAHENACYVACGNKLETALGYATLLGDVNGAIAPIGDLLKDEVFEMARHLNELYTQEGIGDVIPEELLPDELYRFGKDKIKPSAELENDQTDPMLIGFDDAIIRQYTNFKQASAATIAKWYIDGTLEEKTGITTELIERYGMDDPKSFIEHLEWLDPLVDKNVFKRVQTGPNVIVSKTAYGFDRREAQLPQITTIFYEELRDKALEMEKYTTRKKTA